MCPAAGAGRDNPAVTHGGSGGGWNQDGWNSLMKFARSACVVAVAVFGFGATVTAAPSAQADTGWGCVACSPSGR